MVQVDPPPQRFPHAPQFRFEVWVLVHAPLHRTSGVVHWQVPIEQVEPVPQLLKQRPQLVALVWVSMQVPVPQLVVPIGQVSEHVPALQI